MVTGNMNKQIKNTSIKSNNLRGILAALIIFSGMIFVSCNEETAILPGIVRSSLEITTDPDGAKIFLNNVDKKQITPASVSDVEPGFYKISLTMPKYLDTTYYVLLKRGIKDKVFFEMREDPVYWWRGYTLNSIGIPFDNVVKIRVDKFNRKWFATGNNGLIIYENGNWSKLNTSNSALPDNRINDILCASNGLIWFATKSGLIRYNGSDFILFNRANSHLPEDNITCLTEGKNSVIWFGTQTGGLVRYDGINFNIYNYENSGLVSNNVTTITCDTSGTVYVGSGGNGISVFDGRSWRLINRFFSGLRSDFISDLLYYNGELWAGMGSALSSGGIARIRGNEVTNFTVRGTAGRADIITDITFDANGRLWIASADQGLFYMKIGVFVQYVRNNSGILNDEALSVAVDKEGDKWIGGTGISHYWGRK